MLTDEDLQLLQEMIATALAETLEAYGLKKPPSPAALRQQRYRERKAASVTGHNESVTASPEKRNAPSRKRNGHKSAFMEGTVVMTVPLIGDVEYEVHQSLVDELEKLYPAVDVPQTLREIRGWNLTHANQRKTKEGILKHINHWFKQEQNKGG